MQVFPCPFCGLRDETEFYYQGETGVLRPEGEDVPGGAWADYLYMRRNPKGRTSEIWLHLPCGAYFVMIRNSVTHEVFRSRMLDSEDTAS